MLKSAYWILVTLLIAIIVHLIWVSVVPIFLADKIIARFEALDEEKIVRVIEKDEVHRFFNYANPDMIYAYCKFDISDKDLQINAHMPDTYWVINLYDKETRNFYVLSNKQAEVNELVFMLKKKKGEDIEETGEINSLSEQAINIQSDTDTGIVLLRAFVPFSSKEEEIRTKLASTSCEPV